MRRYIVPFLEVLVFIGVFVIIQGASLYAQVAEDDTSWSTSVAKVVTRLTVTGVALSTYPCDGQVLSVAVDRYGRIDDACVFGDTQTSRFARFNSGGQFKYAVAFPDQFAFYELRGVCPIPRCVYAAGTDTFIQHRSLPYWQYGAEVYKDFSKKLQRQFDPATLSYYYSLRSNSTADFRLKADETDFAVQALAVSSNGEWGMIELNGYGLVRINLRDFSTKRIVAPGAQYGLFSDPTYELAISDDGKTVAITGHRLSTSIVTVDANCGDQLVPSMSNYFSAYTIACKQVGLNDLIGTDGVYQLFEPRLSTNGTQLRLVAQYTNGKTERIVLNKEGALPQGKLYLALGDSYTSGEGETTDSFYIALSNRDPPKCHLSSRSYPFLVGNNWQITTKSVACSGARTGDIIGASSYRGQAQQLASTDPLSIERIRQSALEQYTPGVIQQLDFVASYQPDVVTVSIGGNDAGLVGKLTACLAPGTCEWAREAPKKYATALEIRASYDKVRQVVKSIKQTAPSAKVVIVGYPQIIQANEAAKCTPLIGTLLNSDERVFIAESIRYLNQILQVAAFVETVGYADIQESLTRRHLCGSTDEKAMNAIRLGDDIAPLKFLKTFKIIGAESFHPTPLGHELIARSIIAKLPAPVTIEACSSCSGALIEPPPFWGTAPDGTVHRQVEDPNIATASVKSGQEVEIRSPAMTFAPLSEVTIELHSESMKLATNLVKEDGSVLTDIVIPTIEPGYHTLHLLGTAPDGTLVDRYQVVAVNASDEDIVTEDALLGGDIRSGIDSSQRSTATHQGRTAMSNQSKILSVLGWSDFSQSIVLSDGLDDGFKNPIKPLTNSVEHPFQIGAHLYWIVGIVLGLITLSTVFALLLFKKTIKRSNKQSSRYPGG